MFVIAIRSVVTYTGIVVGYVIIYSFCVLLIVSVMDIVGFVYVVVVVRIDAYGIGGGDGTYGIGGVSVDYGYVGVDGGIAIDMYGRLCWCYM